MPRYFTLQQAQSLLAELRASAEEAVFLKAEFERADSQLKQVAQRITLMGGMQVRRDRLVDCRSRREVSASRLKDAVDRIHATGCLVKDLDQGLLDFPTLYHGLEVYLCWKVGESRIEFWHGVTEGFRGRKTIDGEFLDNHRGDRTD